MEIDKETFETARAGVFAAGCVVRGKAMVVRSAADGKEAAACISQFLQGAPIRNPGRPFSSRMGRVRDDEMTRFLEGTPEIERDTPAEDHEFTAESAGEQSHRPYQTILPGW